MVPSLSSKYSKEEAKGLVIIGVTDEDPAIVEKWLGKMKTKPSYPIAILADGKLEQALGVQAFPTQGVIDPTGTITFAGHGGESELSKALASASKGGIWPKKLDKVVATIRSGDLAKAYAELQKPPAGDLDEKEKAAITRFTAYIEEVGKTALEAGRALKKEGRLLAASQAIAPIVAADPPLPVTADAKALQAEIEAAPNHKLELAGGELFDKASQLEDEAEYLDAISGYKAVVKKAPGTQIATLADKRAQEIVEKGLPGFSKSCEKCGEAKKACEKHAKPVKL